jgi:uncharacterized Zn finger protein (UPF0148 family)
VAAALPAPPSTPTPRPLDPNSTQPDLPFLYETIQKAKENASQTSPGETNNPSTQPATRPASTLICPRCSAPLLQRSSFCPSCGSSLSNLFNANALTTVSEPDQKSKKTSQQDKPPTRDTSLDKTMFITQQAQSQAMVLTYQPSQQKPAANPAAIPSQPGKAPQQNAQLSPAATLSSQTGKPRVKAPGSNIPLRMFFVVVIVVLLVLLAIIVLFLISHGHSSNTFINNEIWFSFRSQEHHFDLADR